MKNMKDMKDVKDMKDLLLKEIAEAKCNKAIVNGEVYDLMNSKDGTAFLIKDLIAVKDIRGKSVKLKKGEKENAQVAYWELHKEEFLKQSYEKRVKQAEGKAMRLLKQFQHSAHDHEDLLIDQSLYWIVNEVRNYDPDFYEKQKEKSKDFFVEFPNAVAFTDKLIEYAENGKLDEAYANLVNYVTKKPPAIGIFKYHKNNIENTLKPLMELREKAENMLYHGENESEDLNYLMKCAERLYDDAMHYIFENAKHEFKTYREFEIHIDGILDVDLIGRCYYGNVLCDVIEKNRIMYKEHFRYIDPELFNTGVKAFRMQKEMNDVKLGNQSNGIYSKPEYESYKVDEEGVIISNNNEN